MRALLLLAALAAPATAGPLSPAVQSVMLAGGYTHDRDADAYMVAALAPAPRAQAKALTAMVVCLKAGGVWTNKLGGLYAFASWSPAAALIDIVHPSHAASAINSPTLITNRGVIGDGITSYVDLNDTLGSAGSLYSQNSGTLGAFSARNNTVMGSMTGGNAYLTIASNGQVQGRLNAASGSTGGLTSILPSVHGVLTRNSAGTQRVYSDGLSYGDLSVASSSSVLNTELTVLRRASSYGARAVHLAYYGGGLNDADVATIDACARPYLTSIGVMS